MTEYYKGNRILSLKEVEFRVVYSDMQIWRMEKMGLFPTHIRLHSRRVGWLEPSIIAWMQEKVDARPNSASTLVQPTDRFITIKEVLKFVSMSRRGLDRLEEKGLFPIRVRLGEKRVAWLAREIDEWCQTLPLAIY